MDHFIINILVPVNFSDASNNALRLAIAIAERHQATLHLMNIVPVYPLPPSMELIRGGGDELASLMSESKTQVAQLIERVVADTKLMVVGSSEFGNVPVNTSDYVAKRGIDLVVMGMGGSSSWADFFMGSTALDTIKLCKCPVLTVPVEFKRSVFESILYPVRNVDGVIEKYNYIKRIIKRNHSIVHLLGLFQRSDVTNVDLLDNLRKVKERIAKDNDAVSVEVQISENIPETILQTAHKRNDDLVVINATLDTSWKGYFTGNFTQQVINHARIPVLSIQTDIIN